MFSPARVRLFALVLAVLIAPSALAQQPPPAAGEDRVAALKQSLQSSMAALRQYEWIETTAVSLKGEEKSKTENKCYYGADGKVQKVPVEAAPEGDGKKPRGLRGKIVENKKEDISDSMKEAIGLVKQYIPLDPARIQAAKDAGKVSASPPDAQGKVRIVVSDYLKAGDAVTIDVDAASSHLSGLAVSTFTEKEKDAVKLNVKFAALTDGTQYPGAITLDVASQNLSVAIQNGGYRKMTP